MNNKTPRNNGTTKKGILILGGGFGRAYAALYLEKRLAADPNIEIALIAKQLSPRARELFTDALIFRHREEIGRVIFISSPNVLIANLLTHIIFKAATNETSEWAATSIGDRTTREKSLSYHRGRRTVSYRPIDEPLSSPTRFASSRSLPPSSFTLRASIERCSFLDKN